MWVQKGPVYTNNTHPILKQNFFFTVNLHDMTPNYSYMMGIVTVLRMNRVKKYHVLQINLK